MTTIETFRVSPPTAGGRRRNHALPWTCLIVGLLSLQVGLCAVGVYCATGRGPVAVEADYYNKALHWDDHLAMQQASKRLEWKTAFEVGTAATTDGARAVIFEMHDKAGSVVANAAVELAYFHHARPLDLRKAILKETADGGYVASVPLEHAGMWEFRITAKRGAATFIETIERDVR